MKLNNVRFETECFAGSGAVSEMAWKLNGLDIAHADLKFDANGDVVGLSVNACQPGDNQGGDGHNFDGVEITLAPWVDEPEPEPLGTIGAVIQEHSPTTAAMLYEALSAAWRNLYDHVHDHKPSEEELGEQSNRLRQLAQRLYRYDSFNDTADTIPKVPHTAPEGPFQDLTPFDQLRWLASWVLAPGADESQRTVDAEGLAKRVLELTTPNSDGQYVTLVRFERYVAEDAEIAAEAFPELPEGEALLAQFAVELQCAYRDGMAGFFTVLASSTTPNLDVVDVGCTKVMEGPDDVDARPATADYLDETLVAAGLTREQAATALRFGLAAITDGTTGALGSFGDPGEVEQMLRTASAKLYTESRHFAVTWTVDVDAMDADEAVSEARQRVSDDRFEPARIDEAT